MLETWKRFYDGKDWRPIRQEGSHQRGGDERISSIRNVYVTYPDGPSVRWKEQDDEESGTCTFMARHVMEYVTGLSIDQKAHIRREEAAAWQARDTDYTDFLERYLARSGERAMAEMIIPSTVSFGEADGLHSSRMEEAWQGVRKVLVLDGVADPGNMGSLLRSSWFLGMDAVITTSRRCVYHL